MKRSLLRSSTFVRATKQFLKKHPSLVGDLQTALTLLEADAFHPKLKTHKLKGNLIGLWACSGGKVLKLFYCKHSALTMRFIKFRTKPPPF